MINGGSFVGDGTSSSSTSSSLDVDSNHISTNGGNPTNNKKPQLANINKTSSINKSTKTTTATTATTTDQPQQPKQQSNSMFLLDSLLYSLPIGGDGTYHFKVLVPSVAAGAIIGKGGETIAQLQKDTGARVKMSKSHDFYPGTTERVCLITGSVDAIISVMDFIMDKIREKPDLNKPSAMSAAAAAAAADGDGASKLLLQDRDRQVKILVPNSTAGMIIGKAGSYIKQIKEASGSYVQISQKAKDVSLQERCITVIGDKEANKQACMMILSKVVDDPQSGTCLNVSYADVNGPVANFNPTGSPFAQPTGGAGAPGAPFGAPSAAALTSAAGGALSHMAMLNGTAAAAAAAQGLNLSLNLNQSGAGGGGSSAAATSNAVANTLITGQLLESIKMQLRTSGGYSESQLLEICGALGVLAKYGILAVGLAHAAAAAAASLGPAAAAAGYLSFAEQHAGAGVFGPIGQVGLGDISSSARALERYDPSAAAAAAAAAAVAAQNGSFDPSLFRQHQQHQSSAAAAAPVSASHLNNNNNGGGGSGGGTFGGLTAAQQMAAVAQALGNKSPTPAEAGGVVGNAATASGGAAIAGAPTGGAAAGKDSKNVEIAEVIVGAILGPGGRSLVEIQQLSGASIQISKKGIFAPGTRNRIVTISGSANAINAAHYLIEQRISEEEMKRARCTNAQGAAAAQAAAVAAQAHLGPLAAAAAAAAAAMH